MSMESKELFVNKRAESGFLQNICRFWPADSWCVSKKWKPILICMPVTCRSCRVFYTSLQEIRFALYW